MIYIKPGFTLLVLCWIHVLPEVKPQSAVWNQWTSWSECRGKCGEGFMSRSRTCYGYRAYCQGERKESKPCQPRNCGGGHSRDDHGDDTGYGRWDSWSSWGPCSRTCGTGETWREGNCSRRRCYNSGRQRKSCNTQPCPETFKGHGPAWSEWESWGQCSQSCGESWKERRRQCRGYGGCHGSNHERKNCHKPSCFKSWSSWESWGPCDAPCGEGWRQRRRKCGDDHDWSCHGGRGGEYQREKCNQFECIEWTSWGSWDMCSKSCGYGGFQRRERDCHKGSCPHDGYYDQKNCHVTEHCPEWSSWGSWGGCDAYCGYGRQQGRMWRQRSCIYGPCLGDSTDYRSCDIDCPRKPEWSSWGSWEACDAYCGYGRQQGRMRRQRDCKYDGPCYGDKYQYQDCHKDCPNLPEWSSWGSWEACDAYCGYGRQQGRMRRQRDCKYDGPCYGDKYQYQECHKDCPRLPEWSSWGSWEDCIVHCGYGRQKGRMRRWRDCKYGSPCYGDKYQHQDCYKDCPTRPYYGSHGPPGQPRPPGPQDQPGPPGLGPTPPEPPGLGPTPPGPPGPGPQDQPRTRVPPEPETPEPTDPGPTLSGLPGPTPPDPSGRPERLESWGLWTQWTECVPTCGRGISQRQRTCQDTSGQRRGCPGLNLERRACNGQCGN